MYKKCAILVYPLKRGIVCQLVIFRRFKLQRSMNLEVDNSQLCDKALAYSQILKVSLHFTASRVGTHDTVF